MALSLKRETQEDSDEGLKSGCFLTVRERGMI